MENHLDALALSANRDQENEALPTGDEVAHARSGRFDILGPENLRRQPAYDDDTEDEDLEEPVRNYRKNNQYNQGPPEKAYGERDEFKLKVDIPYFIGNLNIKEFLY